MAIFSTATTRVTAVFICELGCLLMIAAISSNAWQVRKGYDDNKLRVGLWESCSAKSGSNMETNCTRHLKRSSVWLNTARALLLIGTACQLPPFALVLYFGPQNKKRMLFLTILTTVAGLFYIGGLIVYSIQVREGALKMGWSYILSWMAVGLDLIGLVVSLIGYQMDMPTTIRQEEEVGLFEKDPII